MDVDPATASNRRMYDLLCGAVAPRPIAWITTVNAAGLVNAAPFSWFNAVSSSPPMVMVSIANHADGHAKDTLRNIRDTKEFVVNVAPKSALTSMVASSADYPPEVSEVDALHLATKPSLRVKAPGLAASPIQMECRLHSVTPLGTGAGTNLVIGEVIQFRLDDSVLDAQGNVDPGKLTLAARMGGAWYTDTATHMEVQRSRKPIS